nr:PREDICTED: uncharacterized protein LOC108214213 isoform X2 [Daucus carota subsp. sativus]
MLLFALIMKIFRLLPGLTDETTLNSTFNESIAYIEETMVKLGPFDGVLGISMGACIAAALPGMQAQHHKKSVVKIHRFSGFALGALLARARWRGFRIFGFLTVQRKRFVKEISRRNLAVTGRKPVQNLRAVFFMSHAKNSSRRYGR